MNTFWFRGVHKPWGRHLVPHPRLLLSTGAKMIWRAGVHGERFGRGIRARKKPHFLHRGPPPKRTGRNACATKVTVWPHLSGPASRARRGPHLWSSFLRRGSLVRREFGVLLRDRLL